MSTPVIQDFDFNNLIIKKPEIINNSINCKICYQNKKTNLILQTPLCYIPYSIKKFNHNKSNYKLILTTVDYSYDEKTKIFVKNLINIENIVKRNLNNILSVLDINENEEKYEFISSLRFFKNVNVNFNFNIQIKNDIPYLNIYDNHNNLQNLEYILPESECYSLIWLKNIWINKNKFGLNYEIIQIKIFLPIYKLNDCFIIDRNYKKDSITYKDHPIYSKYFKMKKVGVAIQSIQEEMKRHNLDINIINYNETDIVNHFSKGKGKGKGKFIPPPPPPPPINNSIIKNTNKNSINLMDVLKDLSTVKLNKTEVNNKPKIFKDMNINVPSLQEILQSKNNLKKI